MKLDRFIAMATIALLVVGLMGVITARSFAQTDNAPAAQSQDCAANQADDANEVQSTGTDTDTVDLQCGDQNAPDNAQGGEEVSSGPDTDDVQEGEGQQVEDGLPDLPNAAPEAPGK